MIEAHLDELIQQAMILQQVQNIDEQLTGTEYKQNLIQNETNKINKIKDDILLLSKYK